MSDIVKPLARRLAGIADLVELAADIVEECEVRHPRTKLMTGRTISRLLRGAERELVEISIEAGRD